MSEPSNREVQQHIEDMRQCWPEWNGPKLEDSIDGRIEIAECGIFYMAPAKVIDIDMTGRYFTVEINYPDTAPKHCLSDNGKQTTIHLCEVWPPTEELWIERRKFHEENQ